MTESVYHEYYVEVFVGLSVGQFVVATQNPGDCVFAGNHFDSDCENSGHCDWGTGDTHYYTRGSMEQALSSFVETNVIDYCGTIRADCTGVGCRFKAVAS